MGGGSKSYFSAIFSLLGPDSQNWLSAEMQIGRDKLSGTNGAKFAAFFGRRFSLIFADFRFSGNYSISEAQTFADFHRKSQIFADPFVPFGLSPLMPPYKILGWSRKTSRF